ncbi:VOC family protein [Duganella violaceipulchra]|uniref:Glyoxalase superfamily protein PhnB n=1 Tax=Duganella violaceipulchra TaxID=2849652 RepID=A0AA41L2D6_9BURK|nr:VOC family protein [Duganella violaceicalia]MBV6322213.1 VOC family protein [Duganella violaceicalia]MCP2011360.1 putative glyoxalase superfamily protein PhnB [Duganella violaceicalia]
MSSIPKQTRSNVIPCLRYRDAPAAIDWLCTTFGFEATLVVPNEDGSIAHAQLSFGNGMIMLGSVFDTEFGRLMKQPAEIGQFNTQSSYLVVNDADKVYDNVRQAGGDILLDIKDEDYGGRGFTCRDPEGHIWSIGTYDPAD